ncbi:MAG TPA: hypothetical protein VGW38_04845, partial [Chloroflexota bacterium]|nr:hypothetical protein [Chloroflexota bacterium]
PQARALRKKHLTAPQIQIIIREAERVLNDGTGSVLVLPTRRGGLRLISCEETTAALLRDARSPGNWRFIGT